MPESLIYDNDYLQTLEDDQTEVGGEFDPNADYAAPPPPPPDGWYLVKLRNLGARDPKDGVVKPFVKRGWGNIPETFYTQVEAIIVDPGGPQDGKTTSRYNVTTHADPRQNNASAASLVYRAITNKPIPGLKQGAHMGLLMEEFNGQEPLVMAKLQLQGEPQEASKAYSDAKKSGTLAPGAKKPKTYRGEDKFSQNGKVVGYVDDPETGERVVGRPAIIDLKPQGHEGK